MKIKSIDQYLSFMKENPLYVYHLDLSTERTPMCLACGTTHNLTRDHNTLHSLGGSNDSTNINTLCYSCNNERSNYFAQVQEYLYWVFTGKKERKDYNFSYVHKNRGNYCEAPKLDSSKALTSVFVSKVKVETGGYCTTYRHPVYGLSTVMSRE